MARVLLFGAFGDMAGWTEREVAADTLGALRVQVAGSDPGLAARLSSPSTLVIVNDTLLPHSLRPDNHPLAPRDEVAFGPPVSGG